MYSSPLTSPPSLREFRAHFQALASLTRLRILQHLAGVPQTTVQDLADALDVSQPRLSWHLRMLRRGHLVNSRRSGRAVYCSLNREAIHAYQRELSSLMAPRPKVRASNERSEVYLR